MLIREVLAIETAVLQAWPGEKVAELDGWKLRFARGVTGRANSVWPNGADGRLALQTKIEQAEAFYRRHNLPVRFQLGPAAQPAELDAVLAARGYELYSQTHVQTAVLDQLVAQPRHDVQLFETAPAAWLACHQQVNSYDDATLGIRAAIMGRVEARKAFATVQVDGRTAGVGFGVCANGWLGLFCIETLPAYRRQGVGTAVVAVLADWAKRQDVRRAYLQVTVQNEPALALYGRHGFTTAYTYHYRRLSKAP